MSTGHLPSGARLTQQPLPLFPAEQIIAQGALCSALCVTEDPRQSPDPRSNAGLYWGPSAARAGSRGRASGRTAGPGCLGAASRVSQHRPPRVLLLVSLSGLLGRAASAWKAVLDRATRNPAPAPCRASGACVTEPSFCVLGHQAKPEGTESRGEGVADGHQAGRGRREVAWRVWERASSSSRLE